MSKNINKPNIHYTILVNKMLAGHFYWALSLRSATFSSWETVQTFDNELFSVIQPT